VDGWRWIGTWGSWSACTGQGACHPGDVDEGACGAHRRTCSTSCQWGNVSACEGTARAGDAGVRDTEAHGACGTGALAWQRAPTNEARALDTAQAR
jgi:hypothetical protein